MIYNEQRALRLNYYELDILRAATKKRHDELATMTVTEADLETDDPNEVDQIKARRVYVQGLTATLIARHG